MAFLGKEFKPVKSENYEDFLKSLGFPDESIKSYLTSEIGEKITKDGETYTIHYLSTQGDMQTSFKPGVEFDEHLDENILMKSTYTIDGNSINQAMKDANLTATVKREYNGNDLVITMTCDKWDGVARAYYKA